MYLVTNFAVTEFQSQCCFLRCCNSNPLISNSGRKRQLINLALSRGLQKCVISNVPQIQSHLKETVVDFANHQEMQSPFAHQTKVQARTWETNLFAHFLPPPPASVHNPALLMQLHPLD